MVVLEDGLRRLALAPRFQGRVLTSTSAGPDGASYGWVNRDYIASGKLHPEFNPYGGEDRLWVAPEGGQFGFHFDPGVPMDLAHARVPAPLDREPFEMVSIEKRSASFQKEMELTNHSGTKFHMLISRKVSLLGTEETFVDLGVGHEGLDWVGFQSENTIINHGHLPWRKETGLPALWVIGMFNASDRSVVAMPYKDVPTLPGETIVHMNFVEVPPDRLSIRSGVALFKGDSKFRCKVALHPRRAKSLLGSWDPALGMLTVASFNMPQGPHPYVNARWEIQKDPYTGDVVSSYNDGPPEPGAPSWGAYYELETTSPAAELSPGGSLTHTHRTFHFAGERSKLDAMSKHLFGVGLAEMEAFAGA
jgi:hypothetical protein